MIGMLVRMGSIDFFDGSSNRGESEYPPVKSKITIDLSKTVVMAFGRRNASRKAAVFLTAFREDFICKVRQKSEQYCMVVGSAEVFKLHIQNYTIQ